MIHPGVGHGEDRRVLQRRHDRLPSAGASNSGVSKLLLSLAQFHGRVRCNRWWRTDDLAINIAILIRYDLPSSFNVKLLDSVYIKKRNILA